MPFKSEKQRRYLHANEPEVAKRWEKKYGSNPKKKDKLKAGLDTWHPDHSKTPGDVNTKSQPKDNKRRYTPSGLPLPPKAKKSGKKKHIPVIS